MIATLFDRIFSTVEDEAYRWSVRGFGIAMDLGVVFLITYFFIL